MPLPAPTFLAAHGVLQFTNPASRDPGRDEIFIASVRTEFPNVLNRTFLPAETPAITPHLTLASTSSQLALSAVQADFEVRFYGDYLIDIEKGLEYVERKLGAALEGLHAAGLEVATIGLIATLHFSFKDLDESPTTHVLDTHLQLDIAEDDVQDAMARVAVKVRDTYFVTLTLSNYESRVLQRPIMPGMQLVRIRSWEGKLEDLGLELVVDINNNLEARTSSEEPRVSKQAIKAVASLLREVATSSGPAYADTGVISVRELEASSTR